VPGPGTAALSVRLVFFGGGFSLLTAGSAAACPLDDLPRLTCILVSSRLSDRYNKSLMRTIDRVGSCSINEMNYVGNKLDSIGILQKIHV
jgi:hypothetical protein